MNFIWYNYGDKKSFMHEQASQLGAPKIVSVLVSSLLQ